MVYKFGNKTFKTWDDMDRYTRSEEFEKEFKDAKEVKFTFGCVKCRKTIKGKIRSRWKRTKKGSELNMYCKKCFSRYLHFTLKPNGKQ